LTTDFQASESVRDGLKTVRFSLEVDGERVPGVAWMPAEADEPMPLVFIQHPGTSSKDDYFVTEPGQMWANRGWICVGLDAPMHGERDDHDPMGLFQDRDLYPVIAEQFAQELTAAIDQLAERYPVDMSRLGYVGFSMGSMLGIPAVARDGRFKAAAFCLVGEGGFVGPATGPESHVPALSGVAVRIVGKEKDELVPRAATEALYDALPGEKDLQWLPGGHFEIGGDVIESANHWLKRHLAA
jgi:predicted esterase